MIISGALNHSDTIEFDFLLVVNEAFLDKPKSAIFMFSKQRFSLIIKLTYHPYQGEHCQVSYLCARSFKNVKS